MDYTVFLISICGYPKRQQKAQAAKLGFRPANAAEKKALDQDWVEV